MPRFRSVCLYALLFWLLPLVSFAQEQVFQNPRFVKTDIAPTNFIVVDVNGDGLPDLLYAGGIHPLGFYNPYVVQSLLADGKGDYQPGPSTTLPDGIDPACHSGDVNGDGKTDLVCSGDELHAEIGVLLGNGDGTFAPTIVLPVPPLSRRVCLAYSVSAIGDLNHDGHLDVVVTCELGGVVVPMLGDGTGHFSAGATVSASGTHVELLDLNGDGKLDMVVQGIYTSKVAYVFLGNGDGSFSDNISNLAANDDSVLGDVDGDGHPDLIGGGFGVIRIFKGHSDGSFDVKPTQVIDFREGYSPEGLGWGVYLLPLACVDLDGDGHPDLVALGSNGLTVFLGRGDFQFGSPQSYPEEQDIPFGNFGAQFLEDMNGDGHPDYVALGPNGITISYGQTDGTFLSGTTHLSGRHISYLTVADFNEDGSPDVITAGDLQLYLSLGRRGGGFAEATPLPPVSPPLSGSQAQGWVSVTHGDVNGDGHQDLVAEEAMPSGRQQLSVLLGHGDGSFDEPVPVQLVEGRFFPTVLDLNGDGRDDVVLQAGNAITVLVAQRDGSFRSVGTTLIAPGSEYVITPVALGDLNGDGFADLAYVTTNHVAVAAGRGDGSFKAPVFYAVPLAPDVPSLSAGVVALGDLDGDGRPDLAVLQPFAGTGQNPSGNAQLFTFYGLDTTGDFDEHSFTAAVPGPISHQLYRAVYAVDVDGDGRADVITGVSDGDEYPQTAEVARGRADRTLTDPVEFFDSYGQAPLAFADLNGDGRADLLKPNTYGNAFSVLLALQPIQPTGTLTDTPNPVRVGSPFTVAATVGYAGQSGSLQGKVSFAVDGNALGTVSLKDGAASVAGPTDLSIGIHLLTATTSLLKDDQGSYAPVQTTSSLRVVPLPVSVSVSASENPLTLGGNTTISVSVKNGDGIPAGASPPTGEVTVEVDGASLGTVSGPTFSSSLPYHPASIGVHLVTVTYPGDAKHVAGSSSLQLTVSAAPAPVPAPDPGTFNLVVSTADVTLSGTQSASDEVMVSSLNSFAGTVSLHLSGLPGSISGTLTPSALRVASGGRGSATLVFAGKPASSSISSVAGRRTTALASFGLVLLFGAPFTRRRTWKGLALLVALGGLAGGLSGCVNKGIPLSIVAPKVYVLTVTGTTTDSQVGPQSVTLRLTVKE